MIALKFIRYASQYIEDEAVHENSKKSINREKIVDLFLKTSTMLIRLIPLEHQVIGSNLIKQSSLEQLKNEQEEDINISQKDMDVIKSFLKIYKDENGCC
jgi:hypothetical protein